MRPISVSLCPLAFPSRRNEGTYGTGKFFGWSVLASHRKSQFGTKAPEREEAGKASAPNFPSAGSSELRTSR